MIGDIVIFIEDFEFNGKLYKKGHEFKIVGDDSIRGYDLEDADGNVIGETRFISDKYRALTKSERRERKIDDIIKE